MFLFLPVIFLLTLANTEKNNQHGLRINYLEGRNSNLEKELLGMKKQNAKLENELGDMKKQNAKLEEQFNNFLKMIENKK